MLGKILEVRGKEFSLHVTIKCSGKQRFKIWAEDKGRINSKYAERCIDVENKRTIFLSFPCSPEELFIGITNMQIKNDKNFTANFEVKPLAKYNIWLDEQTTTFLKLSTHFSQVCGYEKASNKGRLFTTNKGEFSIKYYPIIKDFKTNKLLNTPARIGHQTGKIEVSKAKFDKYTIPMRMMILLHEFSHKFKNPTIGLPIADETGADINGLYIYLGLGYSKIDAICVFANVFLKAQTQSNMKRMRKIMEYIQKFENGEFAKREY